MKLCRVLPTLGLDRKDSPQSHDVIGVCIPHTNELRGSTFLHTTVFFGNPGHGIGVCAQRNAQHTTLGDSNIEGEGISNLQ